MRGETVREHGHFLKKKFLSNYIILSLSVYILTKISYFAVFLKGTYWYHEIQVRLPS
jgi:hypothetical protein